MSEPSHVPSRSADSARWLLEVYEELRKLAAARMSRQAEGLTLQPTALVHEAWLKLTARDDRKWNDREHFFRSAALAMRRILVESARRKRRRVASLENHAATTGAPASPAASPEDRLLRIDEALKSLEQQDPESARIVLLKYYGGLTNREVAVSLGVSERTVERQWAYARSVLMTLVLDNDSADPESP